MKIYVFSQKSKIAHFVPMVGTWKNRDSQKYLVFEQYRHRPFQQNKN